VVAGSSVSALEPESETPAGINTAGAWWMIGWRLGNRTNNPRRDEISANESSQVKVLGSCHVLYTWCNRAE
jgi:hypothetical protein